MNKKKLMIITVSMTVILIIALLITFINKNDSEAISTNNSKHLYSNSKAVIYYSTTIDYTLNSVANFVSKDNFVSGYKMDGLELGSTTFDEKSKTILLEDQNSFKFVTDQGIETKKFKNPEHTGISTGHLSKGNTFYSLNNTGVQNVNGTGYYSTIRYGNTDYVNQTLIEEWVQSTTDNDNDTIYSFINYFHSEKIGERNRLVQSKLDNKNKFQTTTIDDLEVLHNFKSIEMLANFVYKDNKLYNIINYTDKQNETHYDLFIFDLKTNELAMEPISKYFNTAFGLLDPNQDIVLDEENLYFISDEGDVHQVNISNQKATVLYNIKKSIDDEVLLSIKNKKIYMYYQNNQDYFLTTLHLLSGEKLESVKLKGMNDALNTSENVSPYHLLILE